jgi:hypothetical protein
MFRGLFISDTRISASRFSRLMDRAIWIPPVRNTVATGKNDPDEMRHFIRAYEPLSDE